MEKSEMMLRYEQETGRKSVRGITDGIHDVWFDIWHYQYLAWLEAKATAYDRLMSGGKKTLKEWANIFGMYFAVGKSGVGYAYKYEPLLAGNNFSGQCFSVIYPEFIDYTGDWKDSLTLPDEWEDKQ
jgi:hypothetical protein